MPTNTLPLALSTALTGTVATLVLAGTLAAVARRQGKRAVQPINATSHWIEGPEAGRMAQADLRHTGVGLATNHAAAILWALPLELALPRDASPARIAGTAALVSGAAALLDYGVLPRRLAPGWEHAVGTHGTVAGFAALAAGLALGALVSRSAIRPSRSGNGTVRARISRPGGDDKKQVVP